MLKVEWGLAFTQYINWSWIKFFLLTQFELDYEFQKHSEHKPSLQTEERVGEKTLSCLVGAALSRKHEDKHFGNAKRDINHWEQGQGAMAAPYETGNIRVH